MTDSPSKNRQGLLLPILLPVGALVVIALVLFGFSRILLNVSKEGATVVALFTAAAVFAIVAYVASRKRVSGAALFPMVGAILGAALMIGGVALVAAPKGAGGEGGGAGEAITVNLAAPVNASKDGFQPTELAFTTGVPTNLVFDNKDAGVPHNVVIFDGKDDKAPSVFEGALVTGPASQTYQVEALTAGTYFFHCAVHPTTMTGNITVSDAGGAPSGGAGAGLSISASGLQFSTDKLEMPADTATTLSFDNQDAGTPHNFAVFKDAAYTQNVFTGDLVTGPATQDYSLPALPAGTYYFRCDVHPTMKGTLEVTGGGSSGGSGGGSSGSATPGAMTSGAPSATPSA